VTRSIALSLFLWAITTSPVAAQSTLPLDGVTAAGGSGLFTIQSPATLTRGEWSLTTSLSNYDYLVSPAPELRPPSRRSYRDMDVDHSRAAASLTVGLAPRAELSIYLPYDRLYQNAGDLSGYIHGVPHVGKLNEYGLGHARVQAKIRFAGRDDSQRQYSATAFAEPSLSNGEKTASGGTNFGAGLQVRRGMAIFAAEYIAMGQRNDLVSSFEISDQISLEAGVAAPFKSARTQFIAELSGTYFFGGSSDPAERIYVGGGFRRFSANHRWALDGGVRVNVTMINSGNNSHPIGGVLSLSYRRRSGK
jgi:hypothetical protein